MSYHDLIKGQLNKKNEGVSNQGDIYSYSERGMHHFDL